MANKLIKAKKRPNAPRPDKIDVEFNRDGKPWVDTFQPTSTADAAALAAAMGGDRQHPERQLMGMLTFIRKMLANDDGVPLAWEPTPYLPADADENEGGTEGAPPPPDHGPVEQAREQPEEEFERRFVGPDGEPYPFDQLAKFTAYEAGSSRRRWAHLMDSEEDVVVDAEVIAGVFEHLAGIAAGRPTRRSS